MLYINTYLICALTVATPGGAGRRLAIFLVSLLSFWVILGEVAQ